MASGVPIVASAIPGFSQIIADGRQGLLVPPGDTAAWAGALSALLDDPARRLLMGRAGLTDVTRYDWSMVTNQVLEVYAEALTRADRGLVASDMPAGSASPVLARSALK